MSGSAKLTTSALICGISRATVGQALSYTKGRPIERVVPTIYAIATELGIDPAFAIAEAILESGWGRSEFASERHNWYGYEAFYKEPSKARRFTTDEEGIRAALEAMAKNYFTPGGRYHAGGVGATLSGWAQHWIDGGPANWQRGVRNLLSLMEGLAGAEDME